MTVYKPVRSLERGLRILEALNRANGASIQSLSEATKIHRTTVYRILETLSRMGFVAKSPSDEKYRLQFRVRQLADGFDDQAWTSAIAGPLLRELHDKVLWPLNVATFEYGAMVIRESTHGYSSLSIMHGVVGQGMPMLRTALGRAYLAFCPPAERDEILASIRASDSPDAPLAADPSFVNTVIPTIRQNGFAENRGLRQKNIGAIAIPIMKGERVLACLNIVFFLTAISTKDAVAKFLPILKDASASISQTLQANDIG